MAAEFAALVAFRAILVFRHLFGCLELRMGRRPHTSDDSGCCYRRKKAPSGKNARFFRGIRHTLRAFDGDDVG